jgi:hypothetical protein
MKAEQEKRDINHTFPASRSQWKTASGSPVDGLKKKLRTSAVAMASAKTAKAVLLCAAVFFNAGFFLLGSCSTVPEKPEFNYRPDAELWLIQFELGYLSREDFLTLLSGGFGAKEMEALKIAASRCGCQPSRTEQDKPTAGMRRYFNERAKALRERLK